MGLVMRLLVISLSILVGSQAMSSEAGTTSAEPTLQPDAQEVRRPLRMQRRMIRHRRDVVYVAEQADLRRDAEETYSARVYRLNYVNAADVEEMIRGLLSVKGTINRTFDTEVGVASDPRSSVGAPNIGKDTDDLRIGGLKRGGILVVSDYERVLKAVDSVVEQVDIQPKQVLIEATIIEITLKKNMERGADLFMLDKEKKTTAVAGGGETMNSVVGSAPVSGQATGGRSGDAVAGGLLSDAKGMKFGWRGSNMTAECIRVLELEKLGTIEVLASPRVLVLDKQRAEIHFGDKLAYRKSAPEKTGATATVDHIDIGTKLRLRPFVSSNDDVIRLEVYAEHTTGRFDSLGVPQTNTNQFTTNVMTQDGVTVAVFGDIYTETTKDQEYLRFLSWIPYVNWVPYLDRQFHNADDTMAQKQQVVVLNPQILGKK